MKRLLTIAGFVVCCMILPIQKSEGQIPVLEIIKEGINKVIKAIDLKIQRLQNKTIWLQNAQKTLENQMSKLKLDEISDWVEKHRKLYNDYFDELWKVKAILASYHRIKDIIERQRQIVNEYRTAWSLFRQDRNFTADELKYMYNIYSGMFDESLKSIDQLFIVVNAFATQMSDANRLKIINTVSENLDQQFSDLKDFNTQNKMVSLQRAAEKGEIEYVKKLYGL